MSLRFSLLAISFIFWTSINSSFADETPSPSPEAADPVIEEVLVTGSLLPKGDFVSKAPIATISSTQFEMSNSVNVESLINSMPQVVGGAGRSSTFGQGIATANLRGLGENRTLVLVNSRRFVPTFPDGGTVDLNFIPIGLIDRVEILTGGASAAYGSDALAGVINFILKEETDGWEFNGGGEMTERGDAELFNFNATNGGTFALGRGSYLFHADILERKSVNYIDREITKVGLIDGQDEQGNLSIVQSPNLFPIAENAAMIFCCSTSQGGALGLFNNDGNISLFPFGAPSNIPTPGTPFASAVGEPDGSSEFGNINGFLSLQLPQERKSFKGKVAYEFDKFEVYADVYYSKSEVPLSRFGPYVGFPTTYGYTGSIENSPFLSQQSKELISRDYFFYNSFLPQRVRYKDDNGNGIADTVRLPFFFRQFSRDIGPTTTEREFESLQVELGVKGDLNSSWGYELFAQIGEVESSINADKLINPERLQQGLLLNADGTCVDASNGCVPVNVWSDNIGQEAVDFILYPEGAGKSVTKNKQNVLMATLSGNTANWFTIPGDPGPIGIVVGAEYLEIDANISTPRFIEQGNFEGFGTAPFGLDANINIASIFMEALVPLVSGMPGIDYLEMELAFRSADHSVSGRDSSSKLALSYYPSPEILIRLSYNNAVRSPSINELYQIEQTTSLIVSDPCTIDGPLKAVGDAGTQIGRSAELDASCIYTGVPEEDLYNPLLKEVSPIANFGGNPNLLAEDADTYSLGIVWTPYSIDGLSVSIDFFNVQIDNFIETAPFLVPDMLKTCYDPSLNSGGPNSAACDAIGRDSDGRLTSIFLGFQNLGLHEVNGWDVNVEYGVELFSGYLDLNYFATKLKKRTIQDNTFGETNFKCLGQFNGDCDNLIDYPVFDFKHRLTAAWSKEKLDLQLIWKYNSALHDGDDGVEYFREKIDRYSIVDLSARYAITDDWTVTAGVKNLLDKSPQPIGSNSWELRSVNAGAMSNTYTEYYDVFGRTMFLKASLIL